MSLDPKAQFNDSRLFRQQAFFAGQWQSARSGATLAVTNPASGLPLGEVPLMGGTEAGLAIEAAQAALPDWRARTAKERGRILRLWFELMMQHQEDLARLMTLEQGKPLAESRGEIAYAAAFLEWFGEEGKRAYGDVIPGHARKQRLLVLKQAVGVCAAITPWNFPSAMITRKVGPALAAGCTIVVKPSDLTPFSALALAELAQRAGVPPGVLSVITGDAAAIGAEFTGNPLVRKLSFTGSTAVGRRLMADCASQIKKLSLELGGNAPFIVFDDADLDAAVAGAMACKFRNAGQTCVTANRFLVQSGIYERFAERLTEAAAALVVGDGLDATTQVGPLINEAAIDKVQRHLDDALAGGAQLQLGGARPQRAGTFYLPSVLTGVSPRALSMREETFGPVAPLLRFDTEAEALRMANDTEFGLAAYFYSRDVGRVWRVGEGLEYGMVGINEGLLSTEVAPFGGIKQSGLGREGSRYGLDDYMELKYLCLGIA